MTYFIYARDGAGLIVLRRDSEEAARQRAAELKDLGWLEVDIAKKDEQAGPTRCEDWGSLIDPPEQGRARFTST
jgi:hypothetical protein